MINSIMRFIKCGDKCNKCDSRDEIVYYTAQQNHSDATNTSTYFYENVRCGECKVLKFKGVSHRNKVSTPPNEIINADYFKSRGLVYHGFTDPYN